MGYNHARAEEAFKKRWTKIKLACIADGMPAYKILQLYETEREAFNSDRRFYENNPVSLEDSKEDFMPLEQNREWLEEGWPELISDIEIYTQLMELEADIRKAYYLNKVLKYPQKEIAVIFHKSQQTISLWIGQVAEILKK